MYPYHQTIKKRISNNELIKYEFVEEYNKIKPCLLLYFSTYPYIKPIRQHKFNEYLTIIKQLDGK